eukprot:5388266-Karenia_brevis.AAC.1
MTPMTPLPFPMSKVERLPASATPRGVVRPAPRDPVPELPRQVPRNQPAQQLKDFPPKPPPAPPNPLSNFALTD